MVLRFWLGWRLHDDERRIARWKGIASRLKARLVETIKNFNYEFDDLTIRLMIRQVLFNWGY